MSNLNKKLILERGYVFEDEYKEIIRINEIEKIKLIDPELTENVWVFPLEPSDLHGKEFYFVFLNDPIMFSPAPRPIAGLVGKAKSSGPNLRAIAKSEDCIKCFEKAGQSAIDYFWKIYSKSKQIQ